MNFIEKSQTKIENLFAATASNHAICIINQNSRDNVLIFSLILW